MPPPPPSAAPPASLAKRGLFGLPDLGTDGTLWPGPHSALSTDNNAIYFGILAVIVVTILLVVFLCCFRCWGRKPAGVETMVITTGPPSTTMLQRQPSVYDGGGGGGGGGGQQAHASLPRILATPRVRDESLPAKRVGTEAAAAAAAEPYIAANHGGRKEFPVVRVHVKNAPDEMNLVVNDRVVLAAVYPDGWASGISKRSGGPWLFPLVCLGGSVPRVLMQRSAAAVAGSASSSSSSLVSDIGKVSDRRTAASPPVTGPGRFQPAFSPQPVREPRQLPSPRTYAQDQQRRRAASPQPQQQQQQQQQPQMLRQQQQTSRPTVAALPQRVQALGVPSMSDTGSEYDPDALTSTSSNYGASRTPIKSMYSDVV
ncbi:hypothetical protein HDU87_001099 [Geranomyces variabilis]|uniref:SH3 domain-containing protein n=1 Tax=Geranomyces variabilis TaxID=109894 RepID=A0AAD5XU24_9FUNG|nr:hypothetical protein HDU87_001099 [Geranomyces variabilis]